MARNELALGKMALLVKLNEARFTKNVLGNSKKAIKLCDQILETNPKDRDALLIKAGGLQEIMRFNEALILIQQIIEKWPGHWEAYYLGAMNHFVQGIDQDALDMINKSVELQETFDNVIAKAQMLCVLGQEYEPLLQKARAMDKQRTANFMKHHWVADIDNLEINPFDKIKTKLRMK